MNFGDYVKEHRKSIWLLLGCTGIFAVIFLMYRLPVGAAVYPGLLSLLLLAAVGVVDFSRQRAKQKQLRAALQNLGENLPEPETVQEQTYQELAEQLRQHLVQLAGEQDARYQDMVEYYTTWAHQIKTPIAAMRLKLQNEDSTLSRQLTSDLLRIEQYVDMVMAYLRLESPSTDYVLREYRIDDLVKNAVKTFASEFIGRGLSLNYRQLEGTIVTDEKWFCFVLEQLLSNALKYTRSGSISIYMENKTLCIADTGIGIAPEDLPRIFEKGYTGFNGRKDKHASGLGLYLCRQICGNLNIPIAVKSQPGQGTVIRLDLGQYNLKAE